MIPKLILKYIQITQNICIDLSQFHNDLVTGFLQIQQSFVLYDLFIKQEVDILVQVNDVFLYFDDLCFQYANSLLDGQVHRESYPNTHETLKYNVCLEYLKDIA